MPTKTKPVKVYRGDTTRFLNCRFFEAGTVSLVDGKKVITKGPPRDVSASEFVAQWRKSADDTNVIDLIVETDLASEGRIFVVASAEVTAQMDSSGVWDLQETLPNGEVYTKATGTTVLSKDVTRE